MRAQTTKQGTVCSVQEDRMAPPGCYRPLWEILKVSDGKVTHHFHQKGAFELNGEVSFTPKEHRGDLPTVGRCRKCRTVGLCRAVLCHVLRSTVTGECACMQLWCVCVCGSGVCVCGSGVCVCGSGESVCSSGECACSSGEQNKTIDHCHTCPAKDIPG